MKFKFLFTIVLLFGFCPRDTHAETTILSESYSYTLNDLESYSTIIELEGFSDEDSYNVVPFSVPELTELKSYELFVWKNKKWKKVNSTREITTFFTGSKNYYVSVPSNVKFLLHVELKEKHSIFLGRLNKNGFYDCDSVSYNFDLPDGIVISTNSNLNIDNGGVVTTRDLEVDSIVSYLIHPKGVLNVDYFSNWFDERIKPLTVISPETIPEELRALKGIASDAEIGKACFDYVKKSIKYIDIENGINAIIPRNCEKVLKNGLGDCKDMATLLTSLYRYFDLEAYCAVSRTNSKLGVFDFPAVNLGNHMICALKLNDEWYYLDATEDACIFGDPSAQILGTEVFMIGNTGSYFHDVPNEARSKCNVEFDYSFNIIDGQIKLKLITEGKMNSTFYGIDLSTHNTKKKLEDIFEIITELKWSVDSSLIQDKYSCLILTTDLDKSIYAKVGTKKMYDLSFLPSLKMMCLLFNSSPYPIMDSPVKIYLNFEDKIILPKSTFENIKCSQNTNVNRIKLDLQLLSQKNEEEFESHEINKDWEMFWSKPIITIE